MLTLFSTLFGGLLRFLPEILSFFDKKNDRAHELAMLNAQLEVERLKGAIALDQIQAQGDINLQLSEIQAIVEMNKAQMTTTGIPFIDGLNAFIRPFLTLYWCCFLYSTFMFCEAFVLYQAGGSYIQAFLGVFGEAEKSICASIFGFYFLHRVMVSKNK